MNRLKLKELNDLYNSIKDQEQLLSTTEGHICEWIQFTFGNGGNKGTVCTDKDTIEKVRHLLIDAHSKKLKELQTTLENFKISRTSTAVYSGKSESKCKVFTFSKPHLAEDFRNKFFKENSVITTDQVRIFNGDSYWTVWLEGTIPKHTKRFTPAKINKLSMRYKNGETSWSKNVLLFSNEASAHDFVENHLLFNKVCLTGKDVYQLCNKAWNRGDGNPSTAFDNDLYDLLKSK